MSLTSVTYAKQARSIVNIARVNEDPKAKLIRGKLFICMLTFSHFHKMINERM